MHLTIYNVILLSGIVYVLQPKHIEDRRHLYHKSAYMHKVYHKWKNIFNWMSRWVCGFKKKKEGRKKIERGSSKWTIATNLAGRILMSLSQYLNFLRTTCYFHFPCPSITGTKKINKQIHIYIKHIYKYICSIWSWYKFLR